MQRLEVSGAVRPIYGSLGVKRLKEYKNEGYRTFLKLVICGAVYELECLLVNVEPWTPLQRKG